MGYFPFEESVGAELQRCHSCSLGGRLRIENFLVHPGASVPGGNIN